MSGRNRGRANPDQEAEELRRMWKSIQEKGKEAGALQRRSEEIGHEIIKLEKEQAALIENDKEPSADIDQRLEALYRENVKVTEQFDLLVSGPSNDATLLDELAVATALKRASEEAAVESQLSQPAQRAASGKLNRPPKKASRQGTSAAASLSAEATEEVAAAPSPRISLTNRLNAKDKSRQGSVATTREASVKLEDGAESVASSADGVSSVTGPTGSATKPTAVPSSTNRIMPRLVLTKDEVVYCRHDAKKNEVLEGEGILCRVTAVIGDGKQRRYEVQDADPTGDPSTPFRASVGQLIPIPQTNLDLKDLGKGKQVLAQYPDTTTFYKAEVSEPWKAGEKGDALVRLNFQDDETVREVERRFVLTEK